MTKAPFTLAIDTATGPCSVAIFKSSNLLAEQVETGKTQQARQLLPMIEAALKEAGTTYADLTMAVSTVGPGSFTGLRVGLATARAIGLSTDIPVYGVSTLAAMAAEAQEAIQKEERILCLLNAGKGEVYYQFFIPSPTLIPCGDLALADQEKLYALLEAGPCAVAGYCATLPEHPQARKLRHITSPSARGAGKIMCSHSHLLCAPEPLYIRPPDALLPQAVASCV